jgi:hypothetical protein
MFALTLALTLGTDPTATEMAKPPTRVVDRAELVRPGMFPKEVIRVLGRKPSCEAGDLIPLAGGGGTIPKLRYAEFQRPRISIEFGSTERVDRVRR